MEILFAILRILFFPGLLFVAVGGLLLSGIDRKVLSRMQRRVGPPIVQPFYDFFKLMGKETIIPHHANRTVYLWAPVVGMVSLAVTMLFIPICGFSAFSGTADLLVVLYLLTIPAVCLIVGGSASGSPFAGVGISREMVAMMSYELPLVLVLLSVARQVGSLSLQDIAAYQAANGCLLFHWSMIPAALAMLLVIPAEAGCHPFDVAEAETEICEGPLAEYSGAPLGVFKLNHAMKLFVLTALFCALFLGGITSGIAPVDVLIVFALCAVVMIVCVTLLHGICARLRVEQVFKFYWTVVTGLALVSLILAWFGL
ncbi:MAG: NADH-quinone oxidoreductase subunit H [Clostridiales bacterium]|nr:NADH-quinone oxidoreductase subunit H [Oscillospiraceae bacterium]MDD5906076.1 NADH-quinone oxidoreductase subunit H [Clostridiales bacterium]